MARVSAAITGAAPGAIARVTLTVSGGVLTSPIVQDLTRVDATHYSGSVNILPVGAGYTFAAEALGGTPETVLYRGEHRDVTIAADQTAQVMITLFDVNPSPGPVSKVPVIDGLSSSASLVTPSTNVRVSVTAHSPEGHALTYEWKAPAACGSFADATQATTDWTAPASNAVC